jgi:hypothetical protein
MDVEGLVKALPVLVFRCAENEYIIQIHSDKQQSFLQNVRHEAKKCCWSVS